MQKTINKAAVLGAGVMGGGIAALLAGAGMRVTLLDIVPPALDAKETAKGLTKDSPAYRNRFAQAAKDRMMNPKSGMLFHKDQGCRISVGNLTDHFESIGECDWIIEVVTENLAVKRDLMAKVSAARKPGSIVSTNTSGVAIAAIAEGLPLEFRQHFLGTHFFNPPRYMRLFEMIPAADTLPEILNFMERFAADTLGKGIVFAKDTPNFIGNRIGVYATLDSVRLMQQYGLSIAETDQITGVALGRPKSATFKTSDIVGLDTFQLVAKNVVDNVDDPAEKERFAVPQFVSGLVEGGALGDKAKRGFYQKTMVDGKKAVLQWNPETGAYEAFQVTQPDAVARALASDNKYASMVYGDAPENRFAWDHIKHVLLYSASKVPEITDDFRMIDKAMTWGYNWEKGPFAIWDAIDLERSVARMKEDGESVPAWIEEKLQSGDTRFYAGKEASPYLALERTQQSVVHTSRDASVLDIGDGVLCLEFHSKGNAISEATLEMLGAAVLELEKDWRGLVVGNRGKHFSAGANLDMITKFAESGDWDTLAKILSQMQRSTSALKYAPKPVVAAPFGMTLGGGAEVVLHAAEVTAQAETYMGLVEAGVGLVPGSGGCKESLVRAQEKCGGTSSQVLLPAVKEVWKRIATAAVSASAHDAIASGVIRQNSRVVMNPNALLDEAKKRVLELADSRYMPPTPPEITVLGEFGYASILYDLEAMLKGGFVSQYDAHIAKKIAFILTGGHAAAGTRVSEAYILELEKEAFVSLCGEEKTRQRITHMLTTGKPLRN